MWRPYVLALVFDLPTWQEVGPKDSSRKSTMYVDAVVELVCAAFDEVI